MCVYVCACAPAWWWGGFGISCLVVVAVSAQLSLLSVFIAGVEQLTLCSVTRTEREHFVLVSAQAGVSVCQLCLHLLVWG